ncbi:MAG TPA: ATP-binding cassette domain-containing protein [Acidimicrobiales bacterium]|nr:ATP-binding cassette domain-containing protein [Acidimicrobiales bacterium]
MNFSSTLRRWLARARPSKRALLSALTNGAVATIANLGLLVGAVGLLADSATRPGLRAVAVALVVIELVAFARSPLRFLERMSAHRLGYDAVSTWRRWLVARVGALDYSRWRAYALGDVLERSLRDTDELQMLWLRGVIPLVDTAFVLLLGDALVAVLAPFAHWWLVAAQLLIIQLIALGALWLVTRDALRRDRVLRRARSAYRAELLELGGATPALALLGRLEHAGERLVAPEVALRNAESRARRARRVGNLVVALCGALSVSALVDRPQAALLWSVVVGAYCLAVMEALATMRGSFEALVSVSGGAERLESFENFGPVKGRAWPRDVTLKAENLTLVEDARTLIEGLSFQVDAGRRLGVTGVSGVGKSTLLRALAGLDDVARGAVTLGDVRVRDLDEATLRAHVAYVPSEPGFAHGYALDVATLGRGDVKVATRLLHELGIEVVADTWFEELSRGELARVALVRALVTEPDLVLLDEPTAGLGADETRRLLRLLDERGASVVVASHDPQVLQWCDEVVTLDARA